MTSLLPFFACLLLNATAHEGPWFASGIKIGEATQSTAIVWVRLTAKPAADFSRLPMLTSGLPEKQTSQARMPPDVVPGMAGQVRLAYRLAGQSSPPTETAWVDVSAATDFTHQFQLRNLSAGTRYDLRLTARRSPRQPSTAAITGSFQTPPAASQSTPVRFIVTTCQAVRSIDSGPDGHIAYQQMLALEPHFFVHTGFARKHMGDLRGSPLAILFP
jgi:alkaline phosphatase D